MRKTSALKKNIPVSIKVWRDFRGFDTIDLTINDVCIGRLKGSSLENLKKAFETDLIPSQEYGFTAETVKLDKGCLIINGIEICELSYQGLWALNGAFHTITGYSIKVDHSTLRWSYSVSQDWHVDNLSHRVEDIDTPDYKKTMEELKKKYAPQVTHNCFFAFTIIEYRGDDFNRLLCYDSVGCEPENFDENIRKKVWR